MNMFVIINKNAPFVAFYSKKTMWYARKDMVYVVSISLVWNVPDLNRILGGQLTKQKKKNAFFFHPCKKVRDHCKIVGLSSLIFIGKCSSSMTILVVLATFL